MNERARKLDDGREDGRTSDGQTMNARTDGGWTADRRTDERAEVRIDGWKNCETVGWTDGPTQVRMGSKDARLLRKRIYKDGWRADERTDGCAVLRKDGRADVESDNERTNWMRDHDQMDGRTYGQ